MYGQATSNNIVYLDHRTSSAETGHYSSSTIKPDCLSNITKSATVVYSTNAVFSTVVNPNK